MDYVFTVDHIQDVTLIGNRVHREIGNSIARPNGSKYTDVAQRQEHWSPKPGVGISKFSIRAIVRIFNGCIELFRVM